MTGLSPATAQRLAELEAQSELSSLERGELRAMAHSRPTGDERMRVDRLLSTSAPAPVEAPARRTHPGAYERGLQRGTAAGGTAYTG